MDRIAYGPLNNRCTTREEYVAGWGDRINSLNSLNSMLIDAGCDLASDTIIPQLQNILTTAADNLVSDGVLQNRWQPPVLRPFTTADWDLYSGADCDEPLIADITIDDDEGRMVVEPDQVGLYFDNGTVYFRDFGKKNYDQYFQIHPQGEIFAAWVISNLNCNTTGWELVNTFGFQKF